MYHKRKEKRNFGILPSLVKEPTPEDIDTATPHRGQDVTVSPYL